VAQDLGATDADALMKTVVDAARTIAWRSDEIWRRISSTIEGPVGHVGRHDHPVASGVVLRDREVHLDSGVDPASDPALVLKVALAAAQNRTRIERATLERLAAGTPVFPDPWPAAARDMLVAVLLQGHDAIAPLEALDQYGLLVRVLPEWAKVRNKPQRNAYHRFTVDRHLLEAAANAAALAKYVSRPDLLVLGALFHDIGKGYPGDHTEVGIDIVGRIGPRLGLSHDDVEILQAMVRHHLLLPDVATRRDLSDDATIRSVAEAVGSSTVLELLRSLTEADSLATGPSAWSAWKAELVHDLVARTAHVLGGGEVHEVAWSLFPTAEVLALMGAMRPSLRAAGDVLTVVSPDRPGLFSRIAGVLSLHGFDVLGAQAFSDEQGMAASEFRVEPPAEGRNEHRWDRVLVDLERALVGQLALDARLSERVRAYDRRPAGAKKIVPRVVIDNTASSNATVVEVHALDGIGVLYRITHALAEMGLDIRVAKVQTLGLEVVDAFYVRDVMGRKVTDPFHLKELERAVLHGVSLSRVG
jgi:[protein-PII] uridylyltransferase